MEDKLNALKDLLGVIADLQYTQAVLDWDLQTYMPAGGAQDRGDTVSTIAGLAHQKSTSDTLGRLIEELEPLSTQMTRDSDDARLIELASHLYSKKTRVPSEWVTDFARVTSIAQIYWQRAKQEADFSIFQPYLKTIVDLKRQYAEFFSPYDHIYDPLLDDFERNMKTRDVISIFNQLQPRQVELIQRISESQPIDASFLSHSYSEQEQWDFGVKVITQFGYDWNRGRQDRSAHPFTTSLGFNDIRITTRFMPDYFGSALFGTMHECGHALYEQGLSKSLRRTPLAEGASMAIHESQSRLWENLVGRSLPFWRFYFPQLKEQFPAQLNGVSLKSFYTGINKVEPSLIRVEADEATYNLHIMLRLELEIELMRGQLEIKDLPEAWNTRMKAYLSLTPPDDARGVLQDIHWSAGLIGYFPTYALGNLVSAQLWERIHKDIPDLGTQIERGDFSSLLAWLRREVHQHGAKYTPQELVTRVCGEAISPLPYMRYLEEKYMDIYTQ